MDDLQKKSDYILGSPADLLARKILINLKTAV